MAKKTIDYRSTSADFVIRKPKIAIIAIGAIEQHGKYFPINTDLAVAEKISRLVAIELSAFLLPTIPFSMSECHGSIPGTVWLKPDTLAAIISDVVVSLRNAGVFQILIINGHGGNFILGPITRELNSKFPDVRVVLAPVIGFTKQESEPNFEHQAGDIHPGDVEASIQLYLNPGLVRSSGEDYIPPVGSEYLDYVTMPELNKKGIWGYPSAASVSKGEQFINEEVNYFVNFARKVFGG